MARESFNTLFKKRPPAVTVRAGFCQAHELHRQPREALERLVQAAETELWLRHLPDVQTHRVFWGNDQRHDAIHKRLQSHPPRFFLNYVYQGAVVTEKSAGMFTVLGDADRLAGATESFDWVFLPLGVQPTLLTAGLLRHAQRLLKNGGRMLLSLRHPEFEHILFNQNPVESYRSEALISRQLDLLRQHQFYLERLDEAVMSDTVKLDFSDPNLAQEYRGLPVAVFYQAVKFVK